MQVIVKEENRTSTKDVVFPCLETLFLDNLPNLKGFFLGKNDFHLPSLDNVVIRDCPQLMVFTPGHSKVPKLKYIQSNIGKHSPDQITFPNSSSDPAISTWMPCSFHNLIEINII
ncbi:hypothetical protein L1987_68953 [Smallanthus sonchifolius]|uniref:Uncharacterized protein n=1 Tax=Smallanthus sonchifolius TaxID=185202 RepID=A0ACB9B5M2_9ASTR|nr:hypothetical protein L1987_88075 [Smallanthus sonchifolius]KAI3717373.1 hypothetical protein L1987_68953 [Smallanthus sonchifolius]